MYSFVIEDIRLVRSLAVCNYFAPNMCVSVFHHCRQHKFYYCFTEGTVLQHKDQRVRTYCFCSNKLKQQQKKRKNEPQQNHYFFSFSPCSPEKASSSKRRIAPRTKSSNVLLKKTEKEKATQKNHSSQSAPTLLRRPISYGCDMGCVV